MSVRRLWPALCLLGCSLGVRAEGAFEVEVELAGAQALSIDLPSTAISVLGCDVEVPESCPNAVQLSGRWHAIGGTASEAKRTASTPAIEFAADGDWLRMRAEIPLSVQGLVDLELGEVVLPSSTDVEVVTSLGDVQLRAMTGSVLVDVAVGDVDVRGPMRSTGIHTERGQVVVVGSGPVDVDLEHGGVRVEQTAGANDVRINAPRGGVELLLGSDADVDVRVETPGQIRVQTDAFSAATSGLYRDRSGAGASRIEIRAGADVTIRLAD
ncbi:MAG: hypothetical protein ACRBN8_03310 [Nannocystales bacterium]